MTPYKSLTKKQFNSMVDQLINLGAQAETHKAPSGYKVYKIKTPKGKVVFKATIASDDEIHASWVDGLFDVRN